MTNDNKMYSSFMKDVREEIGRQTAEVCRLQPVLIDVSINVNMQEVRVELLNIGERRYTQQVAAILISLFGLPPYEARRVLSDLVEGGERARQLVYIGGQRIAKEKVELAEHVLGKEPRFKFLIEEA